TRLVSDWSSDVCSSDLDIQVPKQPKTTFNVGRVGGGTSVNSIPFEGWMEIDMRSSDPTSLAAVDANIQKAIDTAVVEENQRWGKIGRASCRERGGMAAC